MSDKLFETEEHTKKYRLYRPGYPEKIYECIKNYYFNDKQTDEKIPLALDVGCGNGQATIGLSTFCDQVIGIDASANQILNAIEKDNIRYKCNPAEDLNFLQPNSVDLITTATTLHWFDIERFVEQVKYVLKPNTGVLAVWTYALGTLNNPMADAVYREFDQILLLPYWNPKRWLVDDYYQSLLPLLPYQSTRIEYTIENRMETTIGQFIASVETFSACQTFKKQQGDEAYEKLLETFREKLINCYKKTENHNVHDGAEDYNSLKMVISDPIRLYLMKKNE